MINTKWAFIQISNMSFQHDEDDDFFTKHHDYCLVSSSWQVAVVLFGLMLPWKIRQSWGKMNCQKPRLRKVKYVSAEKDKFVYFFLKKSLCLFHYIWRKHASQFSHIFQQDEEAENEIFFKNRPSSLTV